MLCPRCYCCLSLVCPHWALRFHPKPLALDALTNGRYHGSLPVGARIWLPFISPPHDPYPWWGKLPIHTVTEELSTCSLTTALIFPILFLISAYLDLIPAFLHTSVSFPVPDTECTQYKARFAALAKLAMCLRWGLAQVLHVFGL